MFNSVASNPVNGAGIIDANGAKFDPRIMKAGLGQNLQNQISSGAVGYNKQSSAISASYVPGPNAPMSGPGLFNMLMPLAGSLVAGAAAASYMTGADFMSAATAFNGALGATAGLAVSPYLMGIVPSSLRMAFPVAMAIAVPAAVGGELDATVAVMGLSASAGAYAVSRYGAQYY